MDVASVSNAMVRYEDDSEDEVLPTANSSEYPLRQNNPKDQNFLLEENRKLRNKIAHQNNRIAYLEGQLTVYMNSSTAHGSNHGNTGPESRFARKYGRKTSKPDSSLRKKWTPFTKREEKKIVNYLRGSHIRSVGINSGTWTSMKEECFSGSDHTVSSLENHYRRKIAPKIKSFFGTTKESEDFLRKVAGLYKCK